MFFFNVDYCRNVLLNLKHKKGVLKWFIYFNLRLF